MYCTTLHHTATHYNTLQHIATHCNTLQRTAMYFTTLQDPAMHCGETYHHKVSVMQKPALDPIIVCLLHGISEAAEPALARKSVEALDALTTHSLITAPQPDSIAEMYQFL